MGDSGKPAFPARRAAVTGYALLAVIWYALGLLSKGLGSFAPFRLPAAIAAPGQAGAFGLALCWVAVALIPLLAAYICLPWFLGARLPRLADERGPFQIAALFLLSALAATLLLLHPLARARSGAYFATVPAYAWILLVASIAANASALLELVALLRRKNPAWLEWNERRLARKDSESALKRLVKPSIKATLLLSFVPLVVFVVAILSYTLLRSFSATIQASVIENGKSLADRTANVIKSNPADRIAAEDYILLEAKKNGGSAYPFDSLSYVVRNPKTGVFSVAASTDKELQGDRLDKGEEAFTEPVFHYHEKERTYEFLAPVTLSKAFLGYVSIVYERDVIFEQYFRTVVGVAVIAALFLYISIFVVFVMGNRIVFPVQLLQLGVRETADRLSAMLRGESRVSAGLLEYRDRVTTRDEIKELSAEIGSMTGIIRGIVPYISVETFQHAEKGAPSTRKLERCFLFTDIRGFTTLSERLSPEEVVNLLNHYLDLQASMIEANGGDIDKYVGDEMMAVFDGPDKELHACAAALAIKAGMAAEKERTLAEKGQVVNIGIGINAGQVVAGSVGARNRMDFTSIGDAVNLAARLEGQNKEYGAKALVSLPVWEKAKERFLCREIDAIAVKGKSQGVRIFELMQERAKASPRLETLAARFEEGLARYRAMRWNEAEKIFKGLVAEYEDAASATFLERIQAFRLSPPEPGWDGVFRATSK